MRYVHLVITLVTLSLMVSCDFLHRKTDPKAALEGTDTAIVGVYIDKNGYPQATVGRVNVYPGQRVVFAGPDKFDILFKDDKSPIGRLEIPSTNGIVIIEVPKDLFERTQRDSKAPTSVELKEIIYRYGIRTNGKVTDPEIGIRRR